MKLFVYGSLLNPDSAERALQRRPNLSDLTFAVLPGYQLAWNSIHRIHTKLTGDINASFLNLVIAPGETVPGQLLDIDSDEFARLCRREKGYSVHCLDCRDATGQITSARVFIDERPVPQELPLVLTGYLDKIHAGLAWLEPDFAAAYLAALPPPPLPLIDGDYSFVDSEQKANT